MKDSLTYTLLTLLEGIGKANNEVILAHGSLTYDKERVEWIEKELAEIPPGSSYYQDLRGRLESYTYSRDKAKKRFEAVCESYNQKVRAFQLLMEDKLSKRIIFELKLKGKVGSIPWYPD